MTVTGVMNRVFSVGAKQIRWKNKLQLVEGACTQGAWLQHHLFAPAVCEVFKGMLCGK